MSEFLDMGGYELYVWGSFAFALAVFAWNVLSPSLSRRATLIRLRKTLEEEQE